MPADVVVGADGANGTTAKAVGLGAGIVHGVALEGNVPYRALERGRYERRAVIELADIPGGYGWVFPKGDHANVGVGAWQHEGPELRSTCSGSALRTGSSRTSCLPFAATACRFDGRGRALPGSGRCLSATRRG